MCVYILCYAMKKYHCMQSTVLFFADVLRVVMQHSDIGFKYVSNGVNNKYLVIFVSRFSF